MSYAEEIVFEHDGETGGEFVGHSPAEDKKHSLYGLPQYAEGQRLHPGIRRDFLGTFEGWDYRRSIQDNAPARQYEWLMVERRLNGRVNGSPLTVHHKPRVETLETPPAHDGPPPYIPRRYYQQSRNRPARFRRHRRDEAGNEKVLREMLAQQERHSQELREREREAAEQLRRVERERDDERFKRLEEKWAEQKESAPADPLQNLFTQAVLAKVQGGDEDLTDRIVDRLVGGQEEKSGGFWGAVGGALQSAIENPEKLIQSLALLAPRPLAQPQPPAGAPQPAAPQPFPAQHPPAPQPAAQPQQPEQAADEPLTFEGVIGGIKEEIIAGSPARESVRAVVRLYVEQPALQPHVLALMSRSDEELLTLLEQATETQLSHLRNAPVFVKKLREGVNERIQPPAEAGQGDIGGESVRLVDASQNGARVS